MSLSTNRGLNHVSHERQQGNKWTEFYGKAVEDKEPESRELKVQLDEQMPFMEGELKKIENEVQVGQGEQIKTTNFIVATWIGQNSNRAFPPDIYRGEQIVVYNYADSDKYYWDSLGRDDNMRHVERIRFQVANERITVKELSEDNTYLIEMDTLHNKHILIRTSDSDEEEFTYQLKIDAKENRVHLCDNADNEFLIESDTPRVFIRNTDGTYVDLNKKNLVLCAIDDLVLIAGRQIIEDAPVKTNRELPK